MALWPAQTRHIGIAVPRVPRALGIWMAINSLDVLLTFYLLGLGGTEGNPMLALVIAHGGAGSMLAVKLGLALAAGLALSRTGRLGMLGAANRLMSLVVVYNLGLLTYLHWSGHPSPLFG